MKKMYAFLLILAMTVSLLSFVGCEFDLSGMMETTSSTSITKPTPSSTTKPTASSTTTSSTTQKDDGDVPEDSVNGSVGLEYELVDNVYGYAVVGIGTCEDKDLVIPSEYKGLPVYMIGENTFNGSDLTSVYIPNSIVIIQGAAFKWCRSLKTVTFENNSKLTAIQGDTFAVCTSLENIIIPDTVKEIGGGAFNECSSMKTVEMSSSVEYIGRLAFGDCLALVEIKYGGTAEQWAGIQKDSQWIWSIDTMRFHVVCSNETLYVEEQN